MRGHVPVRTCVGCGVRDAQRALVRFGGAEGRLAVRTRAGGPGRSAYLHRAAGCWDAFLRRKGPIRSLRMSPRPGERDRLVADIRACEVSR